MPRSAIDLVDHAIVEMTEVNAQTAIGIGASELLSGVSIGVSNAPQRPRWAPVEN